MPIILQLTPQLCITQTLLLLTPMPVESANDAPSLKLTELAALPAAYPGFFHQCADKPDKSRTAYSGAWEHLLHG
jgi:hypothetical protein